MRTYKLAVVQTHLRDGLILFRSCIRMTSFRRTKDQNRHLYFFSGVRIVFGVDMVELGLVGRGNKGSD